MMMLFVAPMFVVVVFLGGIDFTTAGSTIVGVLKYVALLVVTVLIRNTAPRLRIDQAIKFFWGPVTILAAIAVILAFIGY
jgi:NADH-quinone oxidoreductase subunit H